MKSKRTIAWLLTLLTIGSTLIACSDDSHKKQPDETKGTQDVSTDASTDSQTESRELTDLEIRQSIDDGIGEADFGEKNFRIAITGSQVTPGGATEMAELFGKDECIRRMKECLERL